MPFVSGRRREPGKRHSISRRAKRKLSSNLSAGGRFLDDRAEKSGGRCPDPVGAWRVVSTARRTTGTRPGNRQRDALDREERALHGVSAARRRGGGSVRRPFSSVERLRGAG